MVRPDSFKKWCVVSTVVLVGAVARPGSALAGGLLPTSSPDVVAAVGDTVVQATDTATAAVPTATAPASTSTATVTHVLDTTTANVAQSVDETIAATTAAVTQTVDDTVASTTRSVAQVVDDTLPAATPTMDATLTQPLGATAKAVASTTSDATDTPTLTTTASQVSAPSPSTGSTTIRPHVASTSRERHDNASKHVTRQVNSPAAQATSVHWTTHTTSGPRGARLGAVSVFTLPLLCAALLSTASSAMALGGGGFAFLFALCTFLLVAAPRGVRTVRMPAARAPRPAFFSLLERPG